MHHTNMVQDVVAGIKEVLKQEPVLVEAPVVIQEPQVDHVANAVQYKQQQLDAQLQQIQATIRGMQLQYSAATQPTYQSYGFQGHYRGNNRFRVPRGRGYQCHGNW